MKRREALVAMGLTTGALTMSTGSLLSGCSSIDREGFRGILTDRQVSELNEIAEMILPETPGSPGAREAKVGQFMDAIVTDYFSAEQKQEFLKGLDTIDTLVDSVFGGFGDLEPERQKELLMGLEKEAGAHLKAMKQRSSEQEPVFHYYIMIKQMAIWGYLSSEPVAKTAMKFAPIPGRYDPCIDLQPGEQPIFRGSSSGQGFGYATFHMTSNS